MEAVKRTLSVDLSCVRKKRRVEDWNKEESDCDSESVYSMQQNDTDVARDTSDTSDSSMSEYEVNHVVNDAKNPLLSTDESDEVNEIVELGAVVAAVSANLGDIDMGQLADTSTEQSTSPTSNSDADPELPRQDYLDFWTCIKCKAVNENRHVPFCAACYSFRKTFYAERPRRRRVIGRRAVSFPPVETVQPVGRCVSDPVLDVDVVDGPIRGSQTIATVKSFTDSGFESQEHINSTNETEENVTTSLKVTEIEHGNPSSSLVQLPRENAPVTGEQTASGSCSTSFEVQNITEFCKKKSVQDSMKMGKESRTFSLVLNKDPSVTGKSVQDSSLGFALAQDPSIDCIDQDPSSCSNTSTQGEGSCSKTSTQGEGSCSKISTQDQASCSKFSTQGEGFCSKTSTQGEGSCSKISTQDQPFCSKTVTKGSCGKTSSQTQDPSSSQDVAGQCNAGLSKNITFVIGDKAEEIVTYSESKSEPMKTFPICQICDCRQANGGFVHKHTCHVDFACYNCARQVWRNSAVCPLCRSKITNVVRLI